MEKKKSAKFDIDIEIKDLLWEFLRRWRLIVVLALVCGIGLMAYQYRIDMNKTDVKTVKKSQEELEKAMGEQDLDEVSGAVALKNQLDQKSAYMDASILMKINPYAENVVLLQYYISADTEILASDATDAYAAYVEDAYLAQEVQALGTYEMESVYLTELISMAADMGGLYINTGNASQNITLGIPESGYDHSISVKVVGRTAKEAGMLAADVKNAMLKYAQKLAGIIGTHQLQLVSESNCVIVDQTLAELQNRNALAIKTITNNLDSMKNEMTSDQISLYVYRTTVLAETETVQNNSNVTAVKTVSISVKHGVIGAIVGIVLACALIFALYLFAPALRNSEEIKTLYNVKVLGCVDTTAFEKKKLFGFVDAIIRKMEHGNKKSLSFEQEVQMISANILLDCKKNDRKEVFLTSTVGEVLPKEVVSAVIESCSKKGIRVMEGNAIAYDAMALEELAKVGSAVFVEKRRVSLYDELYQEILLCKENEIDVIGVIVLGV